VTGEAAAHARDLSRARTGDQVAFERLVERYCSELPIHCYSQQDQPAPESLPVVAALLFESTR
jgi:hypothetical protein